MMSQRAYGGLQATSRSEGEDARRIVLLRAARRFRITPRELQVLELTLDGRPAAEIAATLALSVSTVVGHLTRLRIKTRTHSCGAMIARVLGWETSNAAMTTPL
jgi:DNA-binding CsgD family transcriptional regulator